MKVVAMFTKCQCIEHALATFPEVMIKLDARAEGVVVPQHFRDQQELNLRVGLDLRPAITDLKVTEYFVHATLQFGGVSFRCRIPMKAVYGVTVGDDFVVWPADIPRDGTASVPEVAAEPAPEPVKPQRPGHLKLVQ